MIRQKVPKGSLRPQSLAFVGETRVTAAAASATESLSFTLAPAGIAVQQRVHGEGETDVRKMTFPPSFHISVTIVSPG